jgi:predicted kinase
MKQKRLWLTSGVPGSGKSTWVKNKLMRDGGIWISRDEIRFSLLEDNEDYFAHEDEVIRLWTEKIHNAIKDPEVWNVLIDATHLNDKSRKNIIDNLPEGDYVIVITIFDVPLETCYARNNLRAGRSKVPQTAICNMYQSYRFPDKATENFDHIFIVNENGDIKEV